MSRIALAFCLAFVPLSLLADEAGWSVTVTPTAPISLEPVYARVVNSQTCTIDPAETRVRQEGSTIVVVVRGLDGCLPTTGPISQDVSLGQFHPGEFSVVVRSFLGLQLTSAPFRVADSHTGSNAPMPMVNYTDLWWNPQESGWGISLSHHPSGRLFAAWYTYDQARNPTWFTLQPGHWTSVTTYTGPIYRTAGPSWTGPFNPASVSVTLVGTGTFTFVDATSATFTYSVEGVSGSRHIERMVF